MRWLQNREASHTRIHGISAPDRNVDGDQCVDVPVDIDVAVIDAPAGLAGNQLVDYTCGAHAILLPVLPSDLDIHAAARLISDLLLAAQVSRRKGRLAVVANRVRERTVAYQQLRSFLDRLSIPVVGTLRDTQNYVWAASNGLSIHEMQPHRVSRDLAQWASVTQWLEGCLEKPITSRDLLRPTREATDRSNNGLRTAMLFPAAAVFALLAASLFWFMSPQDGAHALPVQAAGAMIKPPPAVSDAPSETVMPSEPVAVSASEELRQKWQLSGVARVGDASVMILRDRQGKSIRRIGAKDDLDGWTVTDTGPNYAVLSQDGEKVRLVINEEMEP